MPESQRNRVLVRGHVPDLAEVRDARQISRWECRLALMRPSSSRRVACGAGVDEKERTAEGAATARTAARDDEKRADMVLKYKEPERDECTAL